MKKILLALILSVSATMVSAGEVKQVDCKEILKTFKPDFSGLNKENKECVLEAMVEGFNTKLPSRIDKFTTLDSLLKMGDTLSYHYTIMNTPDDMDKKKVADIMSHMLVNSNCSTPPIRNIINQEISIQHMYYDKEQSLMFQTTVTKEDCEKRDKRIKEKEAKKAKK